MVGLQKGLQGGGEWNLSWQKLGAGASLSSAGEILPTASSSENRNRSVNMEANECASKSEPLESNARNSQQGGGEAPPVLPHPIIYRVGFCK